MLCIEEIAKEQFYILREHVINITRQNFVIRRITFLEESYFID